MAVAVAGAVAVGLPIWLHLLKRHKTDPKLFPSLMFFEFRETSSVKHRKLDHILLFVLRTLMLLLLALLFANRTAAAHGYELTVIYLGKTATAVLMVGLGLIMVTHASSHWPAYLVEVGLGLSLLAGAVYLFTVRARLRMESANPGT